MGHVRDLPPEKLGVRVEDGSFQPEYQPVRGRGKTLTEIKTLAKEASAVLLATDPDREGEAIAWHVATAAGLGRRGQTLQRVEFHEITANAIRKAVANPRQIDMNLVNAQQARRVLDRLVGYRLSPLLWNKVQRGLSAGRVQSVALRVVVEREKEIEAFVPREFWTVEADLAKHPWNKQRKEVFHAVLFNREKQPKKWEFDSGDEAREVVEELEGAGWKIQAIRKKEGLRRPGPPFTTSTLQQEASRKLSFNAKKTMKVAQELYEGVALGQEGNTGLITYMRTDSVNVAWEAQQAARPVIEKQFGAEYLPEKPPRYSNKSPGAQEAHEAIRPTDPARLPDNVKAYLSAEQFRLYRLVWQRFIASQMAPARVETTEIDVEARPVNPALRPYMFRASGERILFPGFLAAYREGRGDGDELDEEKGLPPLYESDLLDLLKLSAEQHFTQPPPRYGEATLVKALEELGVGRPSTYATILSTIQERGYVEIRGEKKEKKFQATSLGRAVNDLLVERFPDLLDVKFTARLETELDEIAEGKREWVPLVASVYKPLMERLELAQKEVRKIEVEQIPIKPAAKSKTPTRRNYRRSSTTTKRGKEEKPVPTIETGNGIVCEKCGKPMVKRNGPYGEFYGCSGFPNCRGIRKIN
jgi:DNA topoisomerase-1